MARPIAESAGRAANVRLRPPRCTYLPMTTYRKKLTEVALPLEEINEASAREKSIRHGHPSTLHLWWARRPLAACRAVLFASIIDDPGEEGVPAELLERIDRLPLPYKYRAEWESYDEAEQRRKRLFGFIEKLVQWENSNDEGILETARELIHAASDGNPPAVLDPFCGSGSIPLEALRLGLEAHASDLNPVAVLITKALIEIPPKFAGMPPVNPEAREKLAHSGEWKGAAGLAEDVRYYGRWMRDEAEKRIGHFYPKAKLPDGTEASVIAWIWARTVKCPNPACGIQMPLIRSFVLCAKPGNQIWIKPLVAPGVDRVAFTTESAAGKPRAGTVGRNGAVCLSCNTPVSLSYVRTEGKTKRMGAQLMAIVAEGRGGRVYLPPTYEHDVIAAAAHPAWKPEELVTTPSHDVDRLPMYGMLTWGDAFTARQLVALTAFSDLVGEARRRAKHDGSAAGLTDDNAQSRADALATYLAFTLDRQADLGNSLNRWEPNAQCPRQLFGRQAIAMVWDFAEGNPIGSSSGSWTVLIGNLIRSLKSPLMSYNRQAIGHTQQSDAVSGAFATNVMFCTDPPYYDNIGYADLSDFFYVWLRRTLSTIYPDLFGTLLTPKSEELIATSYRFGGSKDRAREFFEAGLRVVFQRMCSETHASFPVTVFYAFKQSESAGDSPGDQSFVSTGWEAMLRGLIDSGFQVTATWPMRTEMASRMVGQGTNALASSIVLTCRPRPERASVTSRREFQSVLRSELPCALRVLQQGNVAPVDFAQAAIGPGMAVFSQFKAVLESDGKPMNVRTALQIINEVLDEAVNPIECDSETRWAVDWFRQYGLRSAEFGVAETLAKAKNVAIDGLREAGIVSSAGGKVKLLARNELKEVYDPAKDPRVTVWEVTQYLARALDKHGVSGAAKLMRRYHDHRPHVDLEQARELCFTLYTICERKGWAQDGRAYNALAMNWSDIEVESQKDEAVDYGGLFAGLGI